MSVAAWRRLLVGLAVTLGAIAPFAGEPTPTSPRQAGLDTATLAAQVAREEDHVTARELAAWIRARKPGLRVIDLRPRQEFVAHHLPGARPATIEEVVKTRFAPGDTLVLYSAGGAHAAQAWVLLRAAGYERVYFLRGGYREWTAFLQSDAEASAYFGRAPEANGEEVDGC